MSGEAVSCLNTSNPFYDGKALLSPYYVMDLFLSLLSLLHLMNSRSVSGILLECVCMLSPIRLCDLMCCSLPGSSVYGIL